MFWAVGVGCDWGRVFGCVSGGENLVVLVGLVQNVLVIFLGGSMSGVLAIVHFALHTYSRAYPGAPKPPQLGSGSGRTGQAAGVSRLDDQPPSGPRAQAFSGLGAHRGMGTADGASSCPPPRYCRTLPLGSHEEQLPAQRPMVSCHAQRAACGWAAWW